MEGWIIDARGGGSYMAERPGRQPVFNMGLEPVYEVWFWDEVSRLWFVMTTDADAAAEQGAVAFHPQHSKEQLVQLREQWRAYRAAGGREPDRAARH